MDRKLSVVANVRYQSTRGKGASKLKGLLRYLQYRDDRDGHIPQEHGLERWVDHGLGSNFQTVAATCEALKSEHVQAFTLVINPQPDLVAFVPERHHESLVRELSTRTIEQFFEARGLDTPEYSLVLHRRETTDKKAPGRDNPHAHIILPGTYASWADGERLPLYMNNNRRDNHIQLLHTIAQEQLDLLLQRDVGLDWEQRYDRQLEQQQYLEALKARLPVPQTPARMPKDLSPTFGLDPASRLAREPEPDREDEPSLRWSGPSLDL